MIYLHKIAPLFVMPIATLVISLFLCIYFNKNKVAYLILIIFYTISTPLFSDYFIKLVEGDFFPSQTETINEADAIVVLSGMLRIEEYGDTYKIEWMDADRFFGGISIYNAKKSNKIIFTGGKAPFNRTELSEGEILKEYAISYGVNAKDIFVTSDVLNTFEESRAVSEVLGKNKNIILVTSAFHMKRAKALFEKRGFNVAPFKVDFKSPHKIKLTLINLLPSAHSLSKTELGFRELLGRFYYSLF